MCPLLFDGQYADGESGWAYNRFRYYSPDLGIYGAQDPLGLSPNLGWTQGYVTHPGCMVDILGLMTHPKWEPKDVLGKKVYQQVEGQVFDPHKKVNLPASLGGGKGTNVDLMNAGRAPIGVDSKPVNLHHIGQDDHSALVELTKRQHHGNHHTLHIYDGLSRSEFPSDVVPVNREEFKAFRVDYWKQRAADF